MTETPRDQAYEKFFEDHWSAPPPPVVTFGAGWDAAVEQLERPDIIEAAANALAKTSSYQSAAGSIAITADSRARVVLAEVGRLLSEPTETHTDHPRPTAPRGLPSDHH